MTSGARIGRVRPTFPSVVQYRARDGRLFNAPPCDGSPYLVVVHDLRRYEEMFAAGDLGEDHQFGERPTLVDKQKVS